MSATFSDMPLTSVRADHLRGDETLADGAVVLRLSFQLERIYVKVAKAGRITTRRYSWDQQIKVQSP